MEPESLPSGNAAILFDGVCNLCNEFVRFVIDRDGSGHFLFASLQGPVGRAILRTGDPPAALGSIILVESGAVFDRSSAILRILRRLDGLWPLVSVGLWIPRPIRDVAYDVVARNRYDWFGRRDACRIAAPQERARFLDA